MTHEIKNQADVDALKQKWGIGETKAPAGVTQSRAQVNGPAVQPVGGILVAVGQPTTDLDFRVAQALMSGHVEACYAAELLTCFATAYQSGFEIDANAAERKLKNKFRDEFNLTHFRAGVKTVRRTLSRQTAAAFARSSDGWKRKLIRKAGIDGAPGPVQLCERNALLFFENDPAWEGVLAYNEFTAQHAVLKDPPEPVHLKAGDFLEDHHDTQFACWLQIVTSQPWKVDIVRRAIDCFARDHGFHPVRQYLNSLPKWKPGDPERLKTWLRDYAGVGSATTDSTEAAPDATQTKEDKADAKALEDFIAAAGERWMIGAIARVRNPGCEVHHVLVLEGGEGLGKSMLVRKIGKGWSQVMQGALDGKPAQELLASGVWIWEFAELASLKKTSEVESAKAFITAPEDIFRPAYGHRVIKHKRQCAFIATVNGDQYLDSQAWEDGKRRVWPVRCVRPFDFDGLDAAIDLLWAEADYKYEHGHRWHFDRDDDKDLIATAKQEQADRVPESVNRGTFVKAAKDCVVKSQGAFEGSTSIEEIFVYLEIPLDKRKGLRAECGKCLEAAGWKLTRPRKGGEQVRRYWPTESVAPE